jgi:lysozyme family protein
MKRIALALLAAALALAACSTTPKNPEAWMEQEINACLPTAIAFRQALNRADVWSEVFRYEYYDRFGKRRGHAMTAYLYPPGQNKLWTYDQLGSWRTRSWTNDVDSIAANAHAIRGNFGTTYNASWIKED